MAIRQNELKKKIEKSDNMEMLKRDSLLKTDEGLIVKGYALIVSYQLNPQKNGGFYISGNMQAKGMVPFKVWSDSRQGSPFMELSKDLEAYKSTVCYIEGKVDRYSGSTSLVLNDVRAVDAENLGLLVSDFLQDVYDIDTYWQVLTGVLSKNCSEEAYNMFIQLVNPVREKFITEFAAIWHHDNCKSGLLAHSTKVARMATLLKMYPNIMKRVSPDILYVSCALHDIGKIYEYSMGSISSDGMKLSHHTFGVMLCTKNEDLIVSALGKEGYYTLLSVIEQHHGEFGERPRTVAAYVVHLIDSVEAKLSTIESMIGESNGAQIQYDNYKLI